MPVIEPYAWSAYSTKLKRRIEKMRHVGVFSQEDASSRKLRLVKARCGSAKEGNVCVLYWLVDEEDGILCDVRYQVFGASALIGALEAACEVLIGKNYDQAKRIGTEVLDHQLRDRDEVPAFPKDTYCYLNMVLEAIDECSSACTDLPLPQEYTAPPIPDWANLQPGEGILGWLDKPVKEQLAIIQQVFDEDLRPYIQMDGGDVRVINITAGKDLTISYEGACGSCFSSVGATLSYIQQTLRAKVYPELCVTPDSLP